MLCVSPYHVTTPLTRLPTAAEWIPTSLESIRTAECERETFRTLHDIVATCRSRLLPNLQKILLQFQYSVFGPGDALVNIEGWEIGRDLGVKLNEAVSRVSGAWGLRNGMTGNACSRPGNILRRCRQEEQLQFLGSAQTSESFRRTLIGSEHIFGDSGVFANICKRFRQGF